MDKRETYSLHGYLYYVPLEMGFITPVFELGSDKYIQVSDDNGLISSFEKIPSEKYSRIIYNPLPFDIRRSNSDPCLYGFKFNDDEVYYDEGIELAEYIGERTGDFSDNEYLFESVNSFARFSRRKKHRFYKPDFTTGGLAMLDECESLMRRHSHSLYRMNVHSYPELMNMRALCVIEKPEAEKKIQPFPISVFWGLVSLISAGASGVYSKQRSNEHFGQLMNKIKSIDFRLPRTLDVEPEKAVNLIVELLEEKKRSFFMTCQYYNDCRKELTIEHQYYVYERLQNFVSRQDNDLRLIKDYLDRVLERYYNENSRFERSIHQQLTYNLNEFTLRLNDALEFREEFEKQRSELIRLLSDAPSAESKKRYKYELQKLQRNIEGVDIQIKQIMEWMRELTDRLKYLPPPSPPF
jgi:hypothetical protein